MRCSSPSKRTRSRLPENEVVPSVIVADLASRRPIASRGSAIDTPLALTSSIEMLRPSEVVMLASPGARGRRYESRRSAACLSDDVCMLAQSDRARATLAGPWRCCADGMQLPDRTIVLEAAGLQAPVAYSAKASGRRDPAG